VLLLNVSVVYFVIDSVRKLLDAPSYVWEAHTAQSVVSVRFEVFTMSHPEDFDFNVVDAFHRMLSCLAELLNYNKLTFKINICVIGWRTLIQHEPVKSGSWH